MTPGHLATLQASHPGNQHNLRYGIRSKRALEPRAQDVAEALMAAPHTVELDGLGALEVGRLEALVEAIDRELARGDVAGRGERGSTWLIDVRLRASRRLGEWTDRFGMNPKARAEWARDLAATETLADWIRRRREGDAATNDRERCAAAKVTPFGGRRGGTTMIGVACHLDRGGLAWRGCRRGSPGFQEGDRFDVLVESVPTDPGPSASASRGEDMTDVAVLQPATAPTDCAEQPGDFLVVFVTTAC